MDRKTKYILCAVIIYLIGGIGLFVLRFYAGFLILVPGMAYNIYQLLKND